MRRGNVSRLVLAAVMLVLNVGAASAINIDMVTVGNPGNVTRHRIRERPSGHLSW